MVAMVNGEAIYLHSLQANVDARCGDLMITGEDSLDGIKGLYASALSDLIAHVLVRQELHKNGIEIGQTEIENYAGELSGQFSPENYQAFIADGLIAENDWKDLLRDHLAMRLFEEKLLRPRITIELAEISEYYNEHQADFILPELFGICLVHSISRDALLDWQKLFPADISEGKQDLTVQELKVTHEEIPGDWVKDAATLRAGECSSPRQGADGWTMICVREKNRETRLGMAESYALIDKILFSEKSRQAFDHWLEESVLNADIQVTPELNRIISQSAAQSVPPGGFSR